MRLPILILHISAGLIGILSGAAALCFRKGSQPIFRVLCERACLEPGRRVGGAPRAVTF